MPHRSLLSSYNNTLSLIFLFIITITISSSSMAETDSSVPASVSTPIEEAAAVHIVYTDRPQHEELEDYHIHTLSSVLGSEEAAKGALLYTYKHAACGFSAKLTPKQVEQLSKQPGVLQVVKDGTMRLHDSPAKLHTL
ncbi:putative peptidase S8 propeptide/proteinase inhibitor I9 [Helianthus debilis subsp. tardiflorus]